MQKRVLSIVVLVLLTLTFVIGCAKFINAGQTPVYYEESKMEVLVEPIPEPIPEVVIEITSEPEELESATLNETYELVEPVEEEPVTHLYSSITLSDTEYEELAQIVALEAGGECFEGQVAVVEVVFNRVLNGWGDSVHDVLSASGQFSTWKYIANPQKYPPYNEVTGTQYEAIDYCLENGMTVMTKYCNEYGYSYPEHYVYFATYKANGSKFFKLGGHYFSRERVN